MLSLGLIGAAFLLVALVYSLVGHGGGSGYLAVMALLGLSPEWLRPTALSLNVLVATIGMIRFGRAGALRWRLFWPFAVASVPAAFLAGMLLHVDATIYRWLLGVVLLFAAARLFMRRAAVTDAELRPLPLSEALVSGAGIGVLSGLVGVGGGIFLSPLVLMRRWATPRDVAGIAAAFILVNSIAALCGILWSVARDGEPLPIDATAIAIWGAAVVVGGFVGSGIGSRRLGQLTLRRVLAVVLVVAGVKMFISRSAMPSEAAATPPVAAPDA